MTKFLVDRMLGQTAKWLRLMGIDAEYAPEGEDDKLLEIAEREGRIIITRDKDLARDEGVMLVEKAPPDDIIPQVLERYDVEIKPLSRCSKCNGLVRGVHKSAVKEKVPENVYEIQERFWRCEGCGQIYWKGTHWEDIIEKIEEMV